MNTRTPGTEKIQERVGQCVWGYDVKKHRASEYKTGSARSAKPKNSGRSGSKDDHRVHGLSGLSSSKFFFGGGRDVWPATLQATRVFLAAGRRGGRRRLDDKEMDLRPESRGQELTGSAPELGKAGIRQEQGLFFFLREGGQVLFGSTVVASGRYVLCRAGKGAAMPVRRGGAYDGEGPQYD